MTIQTKHFIDLSDIISIRFDCKHCKTSVSVAISGEINFHSLAMCPSCSRPWLAIPDGPSLLQEVTSFAKAVSNMARSVQNWHKGMDERHLSGFSMELEINDPLPQLNALMESRIS